MLGIAPFYNQSIRRVAMAFGTIFKDMSVVRYDANTRAELGRVTVPLSYAGKETYISRLEGDPLLTKGVQIVLPAMSFEITGLKYDASRKTSPYKQNMMCQPAGGNVASSFLNGVPYDIPIQLNLYVRNQEDGLQVVEQILPFFSPDYTVSLNYLSCDAGCTISEDLPFVLEDISNTNSYEGPAGTVRYINWTLAFNAKAWLYGPITTSSLIKTSIVNLRDEDSGNTVSTITVTPNPPSANVTDDFGFTTVITEVK